MIPATSKHLINKNLMRMGLATLEQPRELLDQIAYFIEDHADFRKLLVTVEPAERHHCYEGLKGRLSFEPRPLESYITEAREIAEREMHPLYDSETGQIREPKVTPDINEIAEDAIRAENAKGTLKLICAQCRKLGVFAADNHKQAMKLAGKRGWTRDLIGKREFCPKCSKARGN